jgi:glycosyltransferase involved in cell wall biosynthesis
MPARIPPKREIYHGMYRGQRIAVNISAYNEEALIARTLGDVPEFVDIICVVDDCSQDGTYGIAYRSQRDDNRIKIIRRRTNTGFGGVTVAGYYYLMGQHVDIIANLNGDGQMDASSLSAMLDDLIDGGLDVVKGDRLSHPDVGRMPWIRRFGGFLLSRLTSRVTGYHIRDSQHTYHVIKIDALKRLRLGRLYKRFGYPNDFLIECAKQGLKIKNHTVRPIYGEGETSVLKPWKVAPRILWILAKGWVQIRAARIARKLDMVTHEQTTY